MVFSSSLNFLSAAAHFALLSLAMHSSYDSGVYPQTTPFKAHTFLSHPWSVQNSSSGAAGGLDEHLLVRMLFHVSLKPEPLLLIQSE